MARDAERVETFDRDVLRLPDPYTFGPALIHRHAESGIEEWMAFFEDSEGNTLAIMSREPGPGRDLVDETGNLAEGRHGPS
jgi:hypothetical protein